MTLPDRGRTRRVVGSSDMSTRVPLDLVWRRKGDASHERPRRGALTLLTIVRYC
jgi:hypothetical protein